MLGRYGLMEVGGGDKIQIENTASELRKLGVDVEIKTNLDFNPHDYDIVHAFQLDWTPEIYLYAKKVHDAKNVPLVLSPIHHIVSEVKKFDDVYVFDYRRVARLLFKDQFHRDVFKNVYRSITSWEKLKPTLFSIFYGFKKMLGDTLKMADVTLVQTEVEAQDLIATYNLDLKWTKVVNGVGDVFINLQSLKNPFNFEDYIICVGRIEPRKNQLSVIKAVSQLRTETGKDYQLVLVGKKGGYKHMEYNYYFNRALKENPWIHHIQQVPYTTMPSYYRFAKVCVSASWFESTGLTSLEALYCGTNAVASGDCAKEYLGDLATYCLPDDISSIKEAIKQEFVRSRPIISDTIKEEYTWKRAAEQTLAVYKSFVLSGDASHDD